GVRGDLLPERKIFGQIAQLGAITRGRLFRPVLNHRQEDMVAEVDQSTAGSRFARDGVTIALPSVQTQVVRAPFHESGREGHANGFTEGWEVLEEDLFLE